MNEPVVRISQGFFDPAALSSVSATLEASQTTLEPALRALRGLMHYYVSVDWVSNSMINVSVWESLDAAKQMDTLAEMLAQRDVFEALGVTFRPIRNYSGLWSITP
jgi:hypothetical protein